MPLNPIIVFTKPWQCSLSELAEKLVRLGVDGLELPVRPGYPVNPENMAQALPQAVKTLESYGLRIYSVAGSTTREMVSACGDAGIPLIRVCERIDMKIGYQASVEKIRRTYAALVPALEKHMVTIGLQNHCGFFIGSAIGSLDVMREFEPKHVGIVLDVAHCALAGEPEVMAIDIAWPRLCMLNLKNVVRKQVGIDADGAASWSIYWTTGEEGYASWGGTIADLRSRGFTGPICLCAEYSNPAGKGDLAGDAVEPLLRQDIALVNRLFAR
jgi:sugar phosphate isomerase/epimerase